MHVQLPPVPMKYLLAISMAVAWCVLVILGCRQSRLKPGTVVSDGFESTKLGSLWALDKIVPSDIESQSSTVRSGHAALKITIHRGDKFEKGEDGDTDSERAELTEAEDLYSTDGTTYQYRFSLFIPADFPIVSNRLILAQWKQECPGGGRCGNNAPVLALRYVAGTLSVTQTIGAHRTILWRTSENMRNRWLDFQFRIRFSPHADGRLTVCLNDTLIIDHTGSTAYPENGETGYPSPSCYYFKMGLYRDTMSEPMTVYIDAYQKSIVDPSETL